MDARQKRRSSCSCPERDTAAYVGVPCQGLHALRLLCVILASVKALSDASHCTKGPTNFLELVLDLLIADERIF
jgi:hypothetical protein